MSTQFSFKSTVRRSCRLNPTFKKKLGFQKLEIEFNSKSKKRPRNESKVSPVLFDSPDELTEKSQEVNASKLDVRFTKFPGHNGNLSEDANSLPPAADETSPFADCVAQNVVPSPNDFEKLINGGLNSEDFADEIEKLASEGLNSQNFAFEMKKLANESLNSQDFANAIKDLASDSLNTQDFAIAIEDLASDSLNTQDFANVIEKFNHDDPKDIVNAIEKFVTDSLNSQDFADGVPSTRDPVDEMRKLLDEDLDSQKFVDEIVQFTDPDLMLPNFAAPYSPNVESTEAEVQTALNLNPVQNQCEVPSTVCDGNILPESFRKSTTRASRKPAAGACVTQKMPKSNKCEPVVPGRATTSSETARNLQPVTGPKKRRPGSGAVAGPAKRKSRNTVPARRTYFEPLEIEVISQKAVPCKTNLESDQNLQTLSKKKKGRKPRVAASTAKRKSQNTSPDLSALLEPLSIEGVSQKAVPCQMNISIEPAKNLQPLSEDGVRKPRTSASKPVKRTSGSTFPNVRSLFEPAKIELESQKTRQCLRNPKRPSESVQIRRTRLSDKKQAALESAETELCSLFSSCSVQSAEEPATPCVGSKAVTFNPRQRSNVGTTAVANLSLFDLYRKDTDSANTDDLTDFSDIFSMTLNVGNYSENLNVMSLLRQVTKIEKKLPHFVPLSENWFENFEIW